MIIAPTIKQGNLVLQELMDQTIGSLVQLNVLLAYQVNIAIVLNPVLV
jgi:hypothetical protein